MIERDLKREEQFLIDAAGHAGVFTAHVQERLSDGEERFGSSWAWIGVRRHLRELAEEAADLGAWAALCDQALDLDTTLTDSQREQLRGVLTGAARHGARAYELLTLAARAFDGEGTLA